MAEGRTTAVTSAARGAAETAEGAGTDRAAGGSGDVDSALADVLARLAHELRTPISAIVTLADLLQSAPYGPLGHPKYAEYVESIRTGADHALGVLAETLQGAVNADVAGPATEEEVDLKILLDHCVRLVEPDAISAGVAIERVDDESDSRIRTDPAKLRQIVVNILKNAQKFSPDGGRVRVGYRRLRSGEMEIFVRDNGLGIARSDLTMLMDEAARSSDDDGPRRGRGAAASGLGFAIVRALATACGATFKLTSSRGRGTLARLRFPADRVCVG
jgi:signal transduction histidine kinase